MTVKIVIPARYASSRLPGKPLLNLAGKPLVLHVVDRCIEAGMSVKNIFIATDDIRIVESLSSARVAVVMTSALHRSGTDRINEVAKRERWPDNTVVLNVQGDEPLIPSDLIQKVAIFASERDDFDISTAVVPILSQSDFHNVNVVKAIIGRRNRALYFTRSAAPLNRDSNDDLRLAKRHIGIYAYRVGALKQFCTNGEDCLEAYEKLEQLRALSIGMSIGAIEYDGLVPHGIDTIDDFESVIKLVNEKDCNA
ncbi:3-deoxy-manno-octulosonate cytidylyltransferase [Vibrio lentus]|uniref:3-deoxy-manno-octulosonate cytidylyltransferase n=1 Tax=Vibrio lentus TaxID=136468 RepID=UPI003D137FBF